VMNPFRTLRTARLVLTPVSGADLIDLGAIKSDPRVFAIMLGGVRNASQTAEDLARDVAAWGARGYGIWAVREVADQRFVGIAGLEHRSDNRGIALRFALWPDVQGRGLAREAAGAALRFGHDQAGLRRIVAVAREANFASRTVLGSIGMVPCEEFVQNGHAMILFESVRVASDCLAHSFKSPGD
jgi:RimJ/RimL family protein N-acetyltransferase